MGYGIKKIIYIYIYKKWKLNRENKSDGDGGREGAERSGGGWRDTESLLKVKLDSLRVVMEAG